MTLDVLVLPFYGGKKNELLTTGGVSVSTRVASNLVLGGEQKAACLLFRAGVVALCCEGSDEYWSYRRSRAREEEGACLKLLSG